MTAFAERGSERAIRRPVVRRRVEGDMGIIGN
jgi:hypothetical protein